MSEFESTAGFRRLIAWQKAQSLAVDIIRVCRQLPRESVARTLSEQVVRSAGSVAANIAEGYGRYSEGAYRNHLSIARGSLFETETWLDLLHQSEYLTDQQTQQFIESCSETGRLLTALMKSAPRPSERRVRDESASYEYRQGLDELDQ